MGTTQRDHCCANCTASSAEAALFNTWVSVFAFSFYRPAVGALYVGASAPQPCTVGTSSFTPGDTVDTLIGRADDDLYARRRRPEPNRLLARRPAPGRPAGPTTPTRGQAQAGGVDGSQRVGLAGFEPATS